MFCIPHRIPKHLDEASFDELIQFLRLLLALTHQRIDFEQNIRNSMLFLHRRNRNLNFLDNLF